MEAGPVSGAVVGRFAPSPSGRLHLGNLACSLLAWLSAKSQGGRIVLRIEDLDAERCPRIYADLLEQDLAWLGLVWDEGGSTGGPHGPYYQSECADIYTGQYKKLEAQGLVRIYPNRGAVVTKLSCKELSDVMDTRILLEVGALRLALPHITEGDLARARELLELFSKEKDPIKGAELNLKLHFSLYDPCDNQTLLSLIDQMHANVDRYITPFFGKEEVSAELYTVDEHSQIISACESKDTELATAILRTHLQRTKNLLLKSPLLY